MSSIEGIRHPEAVGVGPGKPPPNVTRGDPPPTAGAPTDKTQIKKGILTSAKEGVGRGARALGRGVRRLGAGLLAIPYLTVSLVNVLIGAIPAVASYAPSVITTPIGAILGGAAGAASGQAVKGAEEGREKGYQFGRELGIQLAGRPLAYLTDIFCRGWLHSLFSRGFNGSKLLVIALGKEKESKEATEEEVEKMDRFMRTIVFWDKNKLEKDLSAAEKALGRVSFVTGDDAFKQAKEELIQEKRNSLEKRQLPEKEYKKQLELFSKHIEETKAKLPNSWLKNTGEARTLIPEAKEQIRLHLPNPPAHPRATPPKT